jgi:hypothetical protein
VNSAFQRETDVSEKHIASIFRVKVKTSKEPEIAWWLLPLLHPEVMCPCITTLLLIPVELT